MSHEGVKKVAPAAKGIKGEVVGLHGKRVRHAAGADVSTDAEGGPSKTDHIIDGGMFVFCFRK